MIFPKVLEYSIYSAHSAVFNGAWKPRFFDLRKNLQKKFKKVLTKLYK